MSGDRIESKSPLLAKITNTVTNEVQVIPAGQHGFFIVPDERVTTEQISEVTRLMRALRKEDKPMSSKYVVETDFSNGFAVISVPAELPTTSQELGTILQRICETQSSLCFGPAHSVIDDDNLSDGDIQAALRWTEAILNNDVSTLLDHESWVISCYWDTAIGTLRETSAILQWLLLIPEAIREGVE